MPRRFFQKTKSARTLAAVSGSPESALRDLHIASETGSALFARTPRARPFNGGAGPLC